MCAGWQRVELLLSILRLGYSPIFVDADLLLFKDLYAYLDQAPSASGLLDAHITIQMQCGRLNATHPYFNIG